MATLSFNSCTDLDETLYNQLNNETLYNQLNKNNFYNNKLEVMQAALRPFTHMQAWLAPSGQNGYYYHAELSADQLAWPQKGRHGYDNGDHIRLHDHNWTANEGRMRTAWTLLWTGVGFVNSALQDLESLDYAKLNISDSEKNAIIAELRVLRAYHYFKMMELWGNIPIATQVGEPLNPETRSRAEVFDFVKTIAYSGTSGGRELDPVASREPDLPQRGQTDRRLRTGARRRYHLRANGRGAARRGSVHRDRRTAA
ncbi:MAG: RagB/SusD family nutrient uptake outer membrane protein [Leadbetterella sp.]|nr:RagB/SusD family nutrient uptake outer membrane protein [Leadbetterella sp.]